MPLAKHLWLQDLEEMGDEAGDNVRGTTKLLMISVNSALCKKTVNLLLLLSKKCELNLRPLVPIKSLTS